MGGVFISVWPVWCGIHVSVMPTPTPAKWRTQRIGNRKPPNRAAWYGARTHCTEFLNLKKVSEHLPYFWNVCYQRMETISAIQFTSNYLFRAILPYVRLFYFFHCKLLTLFYIILYHILALATFLSIITCFNIFMLI